MADGNPGLSAAGFRRTASRGAWLETSSGETGDMGKPAENLLCTRGYAFPGFRCVQLADAPLIRDYAECYRAPSCEYSFVNMFAWRKLYRLSWCLYRGRLLVSDGVGDHVLMPLGEPLSPGELVAMSRALRGMGLSGDIDIVPPAFVDAHPELARHYAISLSEGMADYIYSVEKLRDLKGRKLHKKKNLISQFVRRHPGYGVRSLDARKDRERCLAMAERLLAGNLKISRSIREEHAALKEALVHFEALGLSGLMVTVGDEPVAFSIFGPLSPGMYDIHFEKADFSYKGAAQVINHETAKHLSDRCTHLNREQDLDLPGLRKAKLSYEPEEIRQVHRLTFLP